MARSPVEIGKDLWQKRGTVVYLCGSLRLYILPCARHECPQISQHSRGSLADESKRSVQGGLKWCSLSGPRDLSVELCRREYGE